MKTSCTGRLNVADGIAFSTTKPAGGVCAATGSGASAHSALHANALIRLATKGPTPGTPSHARRSRAPPNDRTDEWFGSLGGRVSKGGRKGEAVATCGIIPGPREHGQAETRRVRSRPLFAQSIVTAATHR